MRILFATTAGEGHFGPMVPFARSAVAAGHDVAVAAPKSFRTSVESAGLKHLPVDDVPGDLIGAAMAPLPTLSRQDANDRVIGEIFGRLDTTWALPKMREAFADFAPDLVFRDPTEFASSIAATETGTRTVIAAFGAGRIESYVRGVVAPVLAEFGVNDDSAVWDVPHVSLLPQSFDDGDAAHPIHRFREVGRVAEPLPDWWHGDEAPLVYVTFGSVAAGIGLYPRIYRHALDQLADLDVRVLLTIGRSADPAELGAVPSNAHIEQWVPQSNVLAVARAAVGHGGFGTTLGAVAAGVPSVVLPLFASDQFLNAEKVTETGVGIGLPGLESPIADPATGGDLAEAVHRVLVEDGFRSRAQQIARDIEELPPVSEFAVLLESLAES